MATKNKFKMNWNLGGTIGHWIFLLGIFLAIVLGVIYPGKTIVASILVLLGILVGLLNITSDEVHGFLIAAVALIVSAKSFELLPLIGTAVESIMKYIVIFVAPAATIVALIAVWKLANKR